MSEDDTEEEDDEEDDDDADDWTFEGSMSNFLITSAQERIIITMLAEMDKHEETRLWYNEEGKVRVQAFLQFMFGNVPLIRNSVEKDLFTPYRTLNLFQDPHPASL